MVSLVTLSACGTTPQSEKITEPLSSDPGNNSENLNLVVPQNSVISDGVYTIDLNTSRVSWQASKVTASHTGLVKIKTGVLELSDNALSKGSFVIDMPSISSDENLDSLVKHLNSADFFATDLYPEAKLEITSANLGANPNEYLVGADLTIKDVTAPINFVAQVNHSENTLEAKANFAINRTTWGIKYGSGQFFQDLGDKMIDDQINFEVLLKASK